MASPMHLMTLADLSVPQIQRMINHANYLRRLSLPWLKPHGSLSMKKSSQLRLPPQSLFNKTVAMVFSKRSTRTRLAAETSALLLGGRALFLGSDDIQLGVNETPRDSARVIGGMCQGIFARVGEHQEIEVHSHYLEPSFSTYQRFTQELARYSPVPIINALSSLWHPTQVLADLLTLHDHADLFEIPATPAPDPKPPVSDDGTKAPNGKSGKPRPKAGPKHDVPPLRPLTIAYVGDSANVLHDMLVTYPRLGHKLRIASPEKYRAPPEVWDRVKELGCDEGIWWGEDPKLAVQGADVVVTDTW